MARKAEEEERLKHEAEKQEREGEMGSFSNSDVKNTGQDKIGGSNTCAVIKLESQAREGIGDAQDGTVAGSNDVNADVGKGDGEEKRAKGIVAVRVLKQIRPRVSYAEKVNPDAPAEHKYEAQVAVDGTTFEGLGESLALAKARAAASALSTLFNLSFEYTPRGFPIYVGDPEAYMHLRLPDPVKPSNEEKNAIAILNELYYESAVYTDIPENNPSYDSCFISVTVDGITAYGRGITRKEAKHNAARAAVEQLRCIGLLQQRMAKKDALGSKRKPVASSSTSEKPVPYRNTVCSPVPENAIAKLNRLRGPLHYNTTDTTTATGSFCYAVHVSVSGQDFTGTGKSKKVARLAASESALRALNMWTAEDDDNKKKARIAALASLKTSDSQASSVFQQPGPQRGFGSTRGIRGQPVPRARGMDRGSRGVTRGRGSFLGSQAPVFPSTGFAQPGRGRGPASRTRARSSGMLSRGTRGRGSAVPGAGTHVAGPVEIPKDKNPIMMLNELYYSAAVFEFSQPGGEQQMDGDTGFCTCTVNVDGVIAYGTGHQKKDAKLNAAISAVQQLQASGMLQKRMADKAAFMSQKRAVKTHDAAQSRGGTVRGSAGMHRGRPAARGSRAPAARGGRAPAARGGRVAPVQGFRGRAMPSNQTWQPQTSPADYMTSADDSFVSFEHDTATGTSQFQDPWRAAPIAQTWYPQTSSADFTTPGDDNYGSYEYGTVNVATQQFQYPWTASRSRQPRRGFNY